MAVIAIIIDAAGVRPAPDPAEVRRQCAVQQFFWLDVYSGDAPLRTAHLEEMGLDAQEVTWAVRFGQTGRMQIGRDRIRVVTWMADQHGALIEVHLIGWRRNILTVWSGDPSALDEIRRQFSERVCGYDGSIFHSAAILLQLLVGTLNATLHGLDLALDDLRLHIDRNTASADFAALARRLHRLQSIAANFDRYSGAVKTATVGIETAPGIDVAAATELNDYVEQVEDVAEQFYERRRWMSDLMHDFSAAVAQRQGEQISRLTLVSMIFLPLTAITGFFGMNFQWLNDKIASEESFMLLGLALPAASVVATVIWLWRRGLINEKRPNLASVFAAGRDPIAEKAGGFALDVDVAVATPIGEDARR